MNTLGMLPYEERVFEYIDSTKNHVLYRVTPYFEGDELVARGVLMEAESLEDKGKGVMFCVWCYNAEPGVEIDYSNGNSHAVKEGNAANSQVAASTLGTDSKQANKSSHEASDSGRGHYDEVKHYILNTNSKRFHVPNCPSVTQMKEKNKLEFEGTRSEAIEKGYTPCGACNP